MKKTVSTAIGGVIFHIEEDAYQQLSTYLESVQRYFSGFSEGREIIQDIEARIAELLQARIKADEREAVTEDDVQAVIATMGTVADFAAYDAAEADAEPRTAPADDTSRQSNRFGQGYNPSEGASYTGPTAQTNWYRSRQDRVLAGVLGGIAAKVGVDALWLRVAYVVFFFGLSFFPAFTGTLFIGYILLAFIMPKSEGEEPVSNIRKLFREPQGQVIGGVAGGLASFLGLDVTIVRVLLVALCFAGGAGFIIYLILWVLTPPASSMTDRMRMRGEPITLSGINDRLSDLNSSITGKDDPNRRNLLERILLLPFELLGVILRGIVPIVKGLVRVFGAFIGLILLVLAVALLLVGVAGISELISGVPLAESNYIHFDVDDAAMQAYFYAAPDALIWCASALFLLLGLDVLVGGLSLIAARNLAGRYGNAILISLTFVAFFATLSLLPQVRRAFKEKATLATTNYYAVPTKGAFTVAVPEVTADNRFPSDALELDIRQAYGDSITLVQTVEGRGTTRQQALQEASLVAYSTRFSDDTLLSLASSISLPSNRPYKLQKVKLVLRVPEGKVFRLSEDAAYLGRHQLYSALDMYDHHDLADRSLVFRRGKLVCVDCPPPSSDTDDNDGDLKVDVVDENDSTGGAHIKIDANGKEVNGDVEDISINRHGIQTTVRDKKTGERVHVHIGGDTVTAHKAHKNR